MYLGVERPWLGYFSSSLHKCMGSSRLVEAPFCWCGQSLQTCTEMAETTIGSRFQHYIPADELSTQSEVNLILYTQEEFLTNTHQCKIA